MWIVIYKSYLEWRVTVPFKTKREAEIHVRLYLIVPGKDYITDVGYVFVKEMS